MSGLSTANRGTGSAVHSMRLGAATIAAAAASVLVGGCTLNRVADRELAVALEQYQRDRARTADTYARTGKRAPTTQPTTAPSDQPAVEAIPPPSLRDYILHALRENPEIKAAEELARASAARVPQMTALPDPMLSVKTSPEPIRTAEGDSYVVLGLSQKLPVPEKLDRAGRIALEEARMAAARLQEVRLRVIGDVKRAYYQLYVTDRTTQLTQASQELLRGLIDVARGQVAAGRRSQDDVLRAQVAFLELETQLLELSQRRTSLVAELNRLLNRQPTTPIASPPDFEPNAVALRIEELLENAARSNPELARRLHEVQRSREGLRLAQLAYLPDLTLGFEWMQMSGRAAFQPPPNPQTGIRPPVSRLSEDGSDNWAITVRLNLPIWLEKLRAEVREARRRLAAAQHDYTAAKNHVDSEIEDALARVRTQQELVALFRDTIIPQTQQAYEVSRAAYASGTSDFLTVIDNWQKWLAFTIQYHRASGELERSVADLEQAVGLSLAELEGSS